MKENTEDENISQTVGEILRDARLKKGKTLHNAADDLCIRRFYLESIEKMEIDNLPSYPYNIGFIRSYAEYLDLNSERIVSSYKSVTLLNADKENDIDEFADKNTEAFRPKVIHVILGLCGLAVIILLWTFLKTDKINVEDLTATESKNENVIPEPEIISETDEKNNIEETVSDSEIPLEQKEDEKIENENKETETPETTIEQISPNHVKISLSGPSWIELKQGDKTLLNGVYKRGFVYEIPYGEQTIISVGRQQNVKFYVEGKLTPVLSAMKSRRVPLDTLFTKKN